MPVVAETRLVAKAFICHDGKILALQRSATDARRPLEWDLPGGAVEPGEDIKAACVREVSEETGLTIMIKDCKTVFAMTEIVAPGVSATFMFFMVHLKTAPQDALVLSHEHSEFAWMAIEAAVQAFTYDRHLRALTYVRDHELLNAAYSD